MKLYISILNENHHLAELESGHKNQCNKSQTMQIDSSRILSPVPRSACGSLLFFLLKREIKTYSGGVNNILAPKTFSML